MGHYILAVITKDNQNVDYMLQGFKEEDIIYPKHIMYTKKQAIRLGKKLEGNIHTKSDEELYQSIAKGFNDDMKDEDGNLYTRYNEDAKFDYYVIGGNSEGFLTLKDGSVANKALIKDIDFTKNYEITSLLSSRHIWYEQSQPKGLGINDTGLNTKEEWNNRFKQLIKEEDENNLLTIVDYHD